LDAFPYLEHVENIAYSESQPQPPPLQQTETFPCGGAPVSDFIAEAWERDALGCLVINLQYNPYYPFATGEEYQYIQCGINKKCMKRYNDNVLKKENTTLRFLSFKNKDGIQKLVASMPDDQALREWELHTFQVVRWIDNRQRPIKYRSRDIINSMRWLIRQPAYHEHLIYAPQHCFNNDTPPKPVYTEMRTAD